MFTGRNGEEVTVTADQAHAWAEYYEPILDAWIPIEATPADLTEEEIPETEASATEPEIPTLPDHRETTAPTTDSSIEEGSGPDIGKPEQPRQTLKIPLWLWLVLLPVPLAELQRLLRRYLHSRGPQADANGQALALWAQIEDLHSLLDTQPPENCRTIAQRAKYSPHRITGEELAELGTAREEALRQVSNANWFAKLKARYQYALL